MGQTLAGGSQVSLSEVKHEKCGGDQAYAGSGVVPAEMLAEVKGDEDAEDHQGDDFLHDLELHGAESSCADAVGGYLETVLKQRDAPTDEDHLPQSLIAELQVAVPGNGHEDVGEDEQNDCPHSSITAEPGMMYLEADPFKSTRPSESGDPARELKGHGNPGSALEAIEFNRVAA